MTNSVTILYLSANPAGTQPLEFINECNKINDEFQFNAIRPGVKNNFNLQPLHDISITDLIRQIQNYDGQIVHFSGHGSNSLRSALIFKNEKGEVEIVPSNVLSSLFQALKMDIRLVFLDRCYSEEQAKAISKHVDFVIGISGAISDEAARKFAVSFYSAVGSDKSIKDSFNYALVEVELLSIPEESMPKLLVKEGVNSSSKILIIEPQIKLNICEQLEILSDQLRKLTEDEIPIYQYFRNIYILLSNFLIELENKNKYGESRITSLRRMVIKLSVTVRAIQTSEELGDFQEAGIKTNRAKGIAGEIIDHIKNLCSEA